MTNKAKGRGVGEEGGGVPLLIYTCSLAVYNRMTNKKTRVGVGRGGGGGGGYLC